MISKAERKLMYPIGLLLSIANRKTCEAIASLVGKSGDALLRMLNEGITRIEDLIFIAKKIFLGKKFYLIIDDTSLSKIYSKMIQGTSDNYDSSSGTVSRSLCSITAAIFDGYTLIPISQAIWTSQEFAQDAYKTKVELALELIATIRTYLKVEMFLADGLYATEKMMLGLIEKAIPFEMRFHSNRIIEYKGQKNSIRDLPELKLSGKRKRRTICATWKGIRLYFTAIKRVSKTGEVSIVYQVSNHKATAARHAQCYEYRWKIEMFFRTAKQHLGLSDCQSRKIGVQNNHIMSVFFAYALLQGECKKLRLKSPEEALKRLKHKKYSQLFARIIRSDLIFNENYA